MIESYIVPYSLLYTKLYTNANVFDRIFYNL